MPPLVPPMPATGPDRAGSEEQPDKTDAPAAPGSEEQPADWACIGSYELPGVAVPPGLAPPVGTADTTQPTVAQLPAPPQTE